MPDIQDSFRTGSGVETLNTVLAEEANRIGADVHRSMLHTSPWIDLIKKAAFPDGMGYQMTSLIYDRSIPTSDKAGDNEITSAIWKDVANTTGSTAFGTPKVSGVQNLADAMQTEIGPLTGTAYVNVAKTLRNYNLKKMSIESPRISIEDLRFAAHRGEQLRAIVDLLAESSRYTWESRYRDEYDRLCGKFVNCLSSSTPSPTKVVDSIDASTAANEQFTGIPTFNINLAASAGAGLPTANISNAIMDKIYFELVRAGAGNKAYGRENGRPVFGLVLSSEASYQLQTEAGFRDDVRYNSAAVSDLIAPLGIEKSFRGFYHLVDDLAPRFNAINASATTAIARINAYTTEDGLTSVDTNYDSADYELAYVLHEEVFESMIPEPISAGSGVTFDPVNYKGDFTWNNIKSETTNPDGTIGYFRGVLASASKPIKTDFGYVIAFKRTSSTPAA